MNKEYIKKQLYFSQIRKLNNLKNDWLTLEQFKAKYQHEDIPEYPNEVLEKMPDPHVSVMIITYQQKQFIRTAIEGVLMQETNFPFEIIIGDDESSDGTREICIEYAKTYPEKIRLFLHRRENNIKVMGRPSHIFQYVYNAFLLRGKYVAICYGDDYWTDQLKLQKQYDFLKSNSEYSYCYHSWKQINTLKDNVKIKIRHSCRIFTLMYLNIYDKLPEEILTSVQDDVFLYRILELEGRNSYVSNIKPTIFRVHGNNLWNSGEELFKLKNSLNTFEQLSEVFKGTKLEKELRHKFITSAVNLFFYKMSKKIKLSTIREFIKIISIYRLHKNFLVLFRIISIKIFSIIKKQF